MADTIPAPLSKKLALVTGGSRGIGAAVAKTLAQQGCSHVAITYTSKPDAAQATLDEIKKINANTKTAAIKGDLLDDDFASKVVSETLKSLGVDKIDIVVGNAAVLGTGQLGATLTKKCFEDFLMGNVWAQYALAREAAQHMPNDPTSSRIIFITSVVSKMAAGEQYIPYASSKAALDAVSRNLALAWGVEKGITVNTISVGSTETDGFWDGVKGPAEKAIVEYSAGLSSLRRLGKVDDIADIVAFVAGPGARWMNGNQIPANGGMISTLQG